MSDDQQSPDLPAQPTRGAFLATAWALAWRGTVAVLVSGLFAMLLVAFVLGGAGAMPRPGDAGTAGGALGLAMIPLVGLLLATAVGLTAGISAIALLVRNQLDHQAAQRQAATEQGGRRRYLRLGRSLRTAVRTAPAAAAVGAVAAAIVGTLVLAAPLVMLVVAALTGWRVARSPGQRKQALRTLRWAVPFAPAAAAAAAAPAVYASIINRAPVRSTLSTLRRQGLRARALTLAGLTAVIVTGWGLTHLALHGSAAGGTGFDAALVVSMLLAGVALGVLAHTPALHTNSEDGSDGGSGVAPRRVEPARIRRRRLRLWAVPARTARVASVTAMAVLASTASLGTFLVPATSASAATSIVIDTAADTSTTVDPDQCRTAGVPCGIRAAVAYAGQLATTQGTVTVTFADDTNVSLAGTLLIPAGVTLDGDGHQVTIDAHHDFRALETYLVGGEGAQLRLRNLRVTGGRSAPGGAGLFTNSVRVTLFQTTWDDNVSSGNGDGGALSNGGAVAAPYTPLTVTGSTFSDNHASDGVGGAIAASDLTMTNSTIVDSSGASGRPEGGAVYAASGGDVNHVTLTGGGGISGSEDTYLQVTNTLASTPNGSGAFPCARITSNSDPDEPSVGNIDIVGTCFGITANPVPHGTLANNGGPTRTIALEAGNPAIGAGSPDFCADADQRGETRVAASCDAGAFQSGHPSHVPVQVTLTGEHRGYIHQQTAFEATVSSAGPTPVGTLTLLEGTNVVTAHPVDVEQIAPTTWLTLPALPQGRHVVVARYTPADGGATQDSAPFAVYFLTMSELTLTTTAPVTLHGPAMIVATITDSPNTGGNDPGVPAATGTVTFAVNGEHHDVDLVDGSAQLHVDQLETATVDITYTGDDYYHGDDIFSEWSGDVTSVNTATTTTATAPASVVYAAPLHVSASAADASGVAGGTVTLVVDGVDEDSATLVDGQASLTMTDTLAAGSHTGYVRFTPGPGWGGSRSANFTVTVTPATSSVSISHDSSDPDAVYPHQPTVGYDATGAGQADVVLKDGDTLVATKPVTLPATGSFTLPIFALHPGVHHLHAEVVASSTATASSSGEVVVTVNPGTATVFARADDNGARVGTSVNVHLSSSESGVTFTVTEADDTVVTVRHTDGQSASFGYVPQKWGPTQLTVTATFDDGNYQTAATYVYVTAERTDAPTPTMTWHNQGPDFDANHPYLTVTYPGGPGGLPAPTGLVALLGPNNVNLGQAFLVDGTADIWFTGQPGACYCGVYQPRLRLSNDGLYLDQTQVAPEAAIPARGTTTTLSGVPASVHPGDQFTLSARVSSLVTTPTGRVEFTVNGQDAGQAELTSSVTDAEAHVTYYVGANAGGTLAVVARYVPREITWQPSTSDTQTATVLHHTAPTVTIDSTDTFTFGQPANLTLHATQVDQFLDAGSTITVTDDQGNVVGTTTWGAGTQIRITPVHGGPSVFYASYSYNNGTVATSAPLNTTVTGVYTALALSTEGTPTVGLPFGIRVTLRPPPAGVHPGLVKVQLYKNGTTAVGVPQYLVSSGDAAPTALIYDIATTKNGVFYTAFTAGDGADLGNGSGQLGVNAAGATLSVRADPTRTYPATYNKALTLAPDFSWVPGLGTGPTDGHLLLSLVGADGRAAASCLVDLPATSCQLSQTSVPAPGSYTIRVSLWGSSAYADVPAVVTGAGTDGTKVGMLDVKGTTTELSTSFSTDPTTWVADERVTATFEVHDTLNDEGKASGVITLRSDYGVLCEAFANSQTSATCTFTVPYPSEARDKQHYSDLWASFAPNTTSLPSRSWNQLGTIAHCYTVTGNITPGVTFTMHAPAVTGSACATARYEAGRAGTLHGFREGTTVTVTRASDPIGPGYAYTGTEVGFADGTSRVIAPSGAGSKTTELYLDQNLTVTSAFNWEPHCVDVIAGYETDAGAGMSPANWRANYPNKPEPTYGLTLYKPSNCDLPYGSSAREVADLKHGIGHYLVGTDVYGTSIKTGVDPAPAKVTWALTAVPGGTAPTATEPFWHVTATEPRYTREQIVYGKFRWSPTMCRTATLASGAGGSLSVTSSHFPTEWSPFEDPSGQCVTTSGEHGYLAGTAVTVTAKPSNSATTGKTQPAGRDYYLYKWFTDEDVTASKKEWDTRYLANYGFSEYGLNEPTYTSEVPGATGHIGGNPYAAQSTVRTLPFDKGSTWVGASYAVMNCIPVKVDLRWFAGDATVRMTASNCAAISDDRNGSIGRDGSANTRTGTRYYTAGTHVDVNADATQTGRKLRWTASYRAGSFGWPNGLPEEVSDPDAAAKEVTKDLEFDTTASFDVPASLAGVTVSGGYFNADCTKPSVYAYSKPGYGYHVGSVADCGPGETLGMNSLSAFMPAAARDNQVTPQWKIHTARENITDPGGRVKFPAADSQDPIVTSTEDYVGYKDKTYTRGEVTTRASTYVRLTFCRDLSSNVTTRIINASGKSIPWTWDEFGHAPTAANIVRSPGSECDGLAAEPGFNVAELQLTEDAQKKWDLVAWHNVTTGRLQLVGPSTQMDTTIASLHISANGTPDTNWEAIVSPRCHKLGVGGRVKVNTAPNCAGADPALQMYNPGTVVSLEFQDSSSLDFNGWSGATTSDGHNATVTMDDDHTVNANYEETKDFVRGLEAFGSSVAQRAVGFFGTAANALILEPVAAALSVVQKVSLVLDLAASGLELLGVHGKVIDGMHSVSTAIGDSVDVLHSLGSCAASWSTGGGTGVLGSGTAGQAATAGEFVGGRVAGGAYKSDIAAGVDLVNIVSGGLGNYMADPAEGWSKIGDIGTCMQNSGETAGSSWSSVGH